MRGNGSQIFSYGRMVEEVTMFTDSDWAGCKETRESSSASVMLLGSDTMKAYTRKQKIIARSSKEAELHAALGASEPKRIFVVEGSGLRDEASVGH